jgi:thiol:disulfide interchange protein DsbD
MRARRTDVCAVALACTIGAGVAAAQSIPGLQKSLLPADQAFRLSARALDASTLEARFAIADGYYLYRDKMHFRTDPVPARDATLPAGARKHDPFFGDVATYRGEVVVRIPLARAAAGTKVTLHADSQGCADVGVCYPPDLQQVTVVVPASTYPGPMVEAGGSKWFK